MILTSNQAKSIFWFGRSLSKVQYLCREFPFSCNDDALKYARAFCLPAFDASSINELILDHEQPASFFQQFQNTKKYIRELKGILSNATFTELNQLILHAERDANFICDMCEECADVIEAVGDQLLFLFFHLGQKIQQLDCQIKLKQNKLTTIQSLEALIDHLNQQGVCSLLDVWKDLKKQPDAMTLYHFSDHLDSIFELECL